MFRSFGIIFLKNTKNNINIKCDNKRPDPGLGISQEKLAGLADMHRTYISTVERSQRNVGIDGVERIAKALKVPMSQLLEEPSSK